MAHGTANEPIKPGHPQMKETCFRGRLYSR
jgi:hypothetical protein